MRFTKQKVFRFGRTCFRTVAANPTWIRRARMNGMCSGKTKKTFTGAAVGAVALATFALVAAATLRAQQTDSRPTPPLGTTLTIHADRSVAKVSPTFYGLMTEEINHAFDGGLYAEMVRNRT